MEQNDNMHGFKGIHPATLKSKRMFREIRGEKNV